MLSFIERKDMFLAGRTTHFNNFFPENQSFFASFMNRLKTLPPQKIGGFFKSALILRLILLANLSRF
jgi:hypothetical protein